MTALAIVFWVSAGLVVYTHPGYPLALGRWSRRAAARPCAPGTWEELPRVSLIVAAYDEEEVIAAKVANALALDYPRERLELIVASDGSADATVERARAAGADLVLDLPRGGKVAAQNAAAERAGGEVLAFSDANSSNTWLCPLLRLSVLRIAAVGVGEGEQLAVGALDGGVQRRHLAAGRQLEDEVGAGLRARSAVASAEPSEATITCSRWRGYSSASALATLAAITSSSS